MDFNLMKNNKVLVAGIDGHKGSGGGCKWTKV